MPNESAALDPVFRALADPTRRAVLRRLAQGPASVGELAQPHAMALPSFLQHIKVLEESGLIQSKKVGRVRTCEIRPARLMEAERWLVDSRAYWEGRLDRLEAYVAAPQAKERDDDQRKS